MGKPPQAKTHDRSKPPGGEGRNGVWIYGRHAVSAALANPDRHLLRLLTTQEASVGLPTAELPVENVTNRQLDDRLGPGAVHQGVAALCRPLRQKDLSEFIGGKGETPDSQILIILDRASDPRNIGAVMRSAHAFGAAALIVPRSGTPDESGVLAKAASGALEWLPIVRVPNLSRCMEELKKAEYWCVGLDVGAAVLLRDYDYPKKVALVLGGEGHGLRRLTRKQCDILVRIPISGKQESLNLSNAAAVALYEMIRG